MSCRGVGRTQTWMSWSTKPTNNMTEGEVLRIIVPNDFVRHLIGKGGSNISNLQIQSQVRLQVQAEASMLPKALGRVVGFGGCALAEERSYRLTRARV